MGRAEKDLTIFDVAVTNKGPGLPDHTALYLKKFSSQSKRRVMGVGIYLIKSSKSCPACGEKVRRTDTE